MGDGPGSSKATVDLFAARYAEGEVEYLSIGNLVACVPRGTSGRLGRDRLDLRGGVSIRTRAAIGLTRPRQRGKGKAMNEDVLRAMRQYEDWRVVDVLEERAADGQYILHIQSPDRKQDARYVRGGDVRPRRGRGLTALAQPGPKNGLSRSPRRPFPQVDRAPPAGIEPATHGLGNSVSTTMEYD